MDNISNQKPYFSNKMNNNNTNGINVNEKFDIENNPYIEDPWTIIESYFKNHHGDS